MRRMRRIRRFALVLVAVAFVVAVRNSRAIGVVDPYWYGFTPETSMPGLTLTEYDNTDGARDPSSDVPTGRKIDLAIDELAHPRALEDAEPPQTKDPIFTPIQWDAGSWDPTDRESPQAACDAGAVGYLTSNGLSGIGYGELPQGCDDTQTSCVCYFGRTYTDSNGQPQSGLVFYLARVYRRGGGLSCDSGYTLNGTVCELTDPSAVTWSENGSARFETIAGDSLECISNDPDCADIEPDVVADNGHLRVITEDGELTVEFDPSSDETKFIHETDDEWFTWTYDNHGNQIDSGSGYGPYPGDTIINTQETQTGLLEDIANNTNLTKRNTADIASGIQSLNDKLDVQTQFQAPPEVTDIGPGEDEATEMLTRLQNAPIVQAVSNFRSNIVLEPPQCSPLSFSVPMWNDGTVSTNKHCEIWAEVSPGLSTVMTVSWSLLAGLIFLRA